MFILSNSKYRKARVNKPKFFFRWIEEGGLGHCSFYEEVKFPSWLIICNLWDFSPAIAAVTSVFLFSFFFCKAGFPHLKGKIESIELPQWSLNSYAIVSNFNFPGFCFMDYVSILFVQSQINALSMYVVTFTLIFFWI